MKEINLAVLTNRQREVVSLARTGLSNKRIAHKLGASEGTIKSHLHTTFEKLGVQSRIGLIIACAAIAA